MRFPLKSSWKAIPCLVALAACASEGDSGFADADGDGLADAAEAEYGADPSNPDTDGDGWQDGAEVEAGTNPAYAYSHPYEGGYYVGWCESPPQPTGPTGVDEGGLSAYQQGDVADNFEWRDQNGEYVSLYSFCGNLTVVQFSSFC